MRKTVMVVLAAVATLAAANGVATAQGVLNVINDKVGIGTDNPSDPLHVVSTTPGGKTMARFTNNGAPFIQYQDTSINVAWGLQPTTVGDFTITKGGTGGAEFLIKQSGALLIGPGNSTKFNLSPLGNLTISGTLTENSSRDAKFNFTELDNQQVLQQLSGLPVLEWSYKDQGARHVGPMAQDFHALFGLGPNNSTLAPRDVAGIALVAVQGLHQIVEEKDQRIDQLSQELTELRTLVEALAKQE